MKGIDGMHALLKMGREVSMPSPSEARKSEGGRQIEKNLIADERDAIEAAMYSRLAFAQAPAYQAYN